jgi:two-component system OmpR family response regulator
MGVMSNFGKDRIGWCIVVADDDPDWRMLIKLALQRDGYVVVEASDGDELVCVCRSLNDAGNHHVLVVSDIDMPARSGIAATVDLHSMGIRPPVLFVTGSQSPSAVKAASKVGGGTVLRKPVSGVRVVEMVNSMRRCA